MTTLKVTAATKVLCEGKLLTTSNPTVPFWSGFSVAPVYTFEGSTVDSLTEDTLTFNPRSGLTVFYTSFPMIQNGGTVNASGCSSLNTLAFYGKGISSINLQGCSSLNLLNLSENSLSSLDITDCSSLTDLRASDNSFTDLDITSCAATLTYLYLYNNQLSQNSIDDILIKLAAGNQNYGTCDLQSATNTAPSSTGLAAKATLQSRGWSVTTN